jgi:subtilisin family serine protease
MDIAKTYSHFALLRSMYPFEDGMATVTLATEQVEDWGVAAIHAEHAWKKTRGVGVKVGVLDTGVDGSHPDLAANMAAKHDTQHFLEPHGTHVAGIIGAIDNNIGVVGVAPGCTLYNYLCLPGDPYSVAAAIDRATAEGCDVLNMSLGGYEDCPELEASIKAAYAKGVILVAAAGNDSSRVSYPAIYPEVIAVSAVGKDGLRAPFAPLVKNHVALPGCDLLSTWPDNQYARLSGTSQATPLLTGIVALILSLFKPLRSTRQAFVQEQLARIDERADDFHYLPHLELL